MKRLLKKILIVIFCCTLLGCQSNDGSVNDLILNGNNELEEIDTFEEEIDDVDSEVINDIVRVLNQRLLIVEIEMHHELLSEKLLRELNVKQSLALQEDLFKDIVEEYFEVWKLDQLNTLLYEENIQINEYDLQEIMDRTSTKSIYTLMLAYEKVFLKDEF